MSTSEHDPLIARLERIECVLLRLTEKTTVREWYSVEEFASMIGKAPYTVREHCRQGRLAANKKRSGHGLHLEWSIPHSELLRYQEQGLRPERK